MLPLLLSLCAWLLCDLASAGETNSGFYVFFKKPTAWRQVYLYSWFVDGNHSVETSGAWPGRPLSEVGGWYRGSIERNKSDSQGIRIIFNDGDRQQTSDLSRDRNGWYVAPGTHNEWQGWYDSNPGGRTFHLRVDGGEGEGDYAPGSFVQVKAQLSADSHFLSWDGADVGLLKNRLEASTQLQMPEHNAVISARVENLAAGRETYKKLCSRCHGSEGGGGIGPSLLLSKGRCPSCASDQSLISRIERTMPMGAAGSCVGSCAESVAKFVRYGLNSVSGADCSSSGKKIGKRQIRLLSKREYKATIRDIFGIDRLKTLEFWPEPALVEGYENNADSAVVSDRHALVLLKAAHEIATNQTIEDLWGKDCGKITRCLLDKAGLALFRRPLKTEEATRFADLLAQSEGRSNVVLEAMLQSPQFLYRSELGSFLAPQAIYLLDPYEIASAISYGISGSPPDQKLLEEAAAGRLSRPDVRRQQVLRLLEKEGARATFFDFAKQWLGIQGLEYVTRDNSLLSKGIRADMQEESKRMIEGAVFDEGADLQRMFSADRTFLSKPLAQFYGLKPPANDWDSVDVHEARPGLLSQGSLLATYANSREASPIKRGVFIRNRLLCQNLPPPPANVDTTIPPPAPGLTIRERLKRHTSQGQQSDGSNSCYSCHQYIDKVGFGLEGFDEIGRRRFAYQEKPGETIDLSGALNGLENLGDQSVQEFSDLNGLNAILSGSNRLHECFATQYFRYSFGTMEREESRCLLNDVKASMRPGKSIRDFIADFYAADGFIYRR